MEPTTQTFLQIAQLPISAVLMFALWKMYTDGKTERADMLNRLQQTQERLESVYQRVIGLQTAAGIDDPPTLPKRPIA